MVAEGMRINSVTRITGIKEDTVLQWVREAGVDAESVEQVLSADCALKAS